MYSRAIVCPPSSSIVDALRMVHGEPVNLTRALQQHRTYRSALRHLGYLLIKMPPSEPYPDSVFVEDPAIIIRDVLVIARLRNEKRQGEERNLEPWLRPYFCTVARIDPPGYIEGGDVLVTDSSLYIGLSARTNEEGAEQLARVARDWCGYRTHTLRIPDSWLHLKGGVSYHRRNGGDIITVHEAIDGGFLDSGYKLVVTSADEHFGANCISRGNRILVHQGRTKTRALLERKGFHVQEICLDEYEKIDGAMSCLSKIF